MNMHPMPTGRQAPFSGQPRSARCTVGATSATISSASADASGSRRTTCRRITTPTICATAVCTRSGSTGSDGLHDPAEQRAPDELPQQLGTLLAGERRAHHPEHRRTEVGLGPHAEEEPHQPLPQLCRVAVEDLRKPLRRVEGQLHRGDEDLLLGAEVVVHEGRVHTGLPGDGAHAGGVVALRGELGTGGRQDLATGVGSTRSTTRPAPLRLGRAHRRHTHTRVT